MHDHLSNSHQSVQKPRLGCAVVIKKGNKILMGLRDKEPGKGLWVLPGGGINFLESYKNTAIREILEETSLKISVGKVIGTYELIEPPDQHRVIIYVWANYQSGKIKASSDLADAKFFSKKEIYKLHRQGKISELVSRVLKDIKWLV